VAGSFRGAAHCLKSGAGVRFINKDVAQYVMLCAAQTAGWLMESEPQLGKNEEEGSICGGPKPRAKVKSTAGALGDGTGKLQWQSPSLSQKMKQKGIAPRKSEPGPAACEMTTGHQDLRYLAGENQELSSI